jgi:hypothetical protein
LIPAENIPDEDRLFHRVHIDIVRTSGGKLGPKCFRDSSGKGMSTDWSKYSSPERTRMGNGTHKAKNYGVTALGVGRVRQIDQLQVVHDPTDDNDAHTNILGLSQGELLTQQRAELYDACGRSWVIHPDAPVLAG